MYAALRRLPLSRQQSIFKGKMLSCRGARLPEIARACRRRAYAGAADKTAPCFFDVPHDARGSEKRRHKVCRMGSAVCAIFTAHTAVRGSRQGCGRADPSASQPARARTTAAGEGAASPSANRDRCRKSAGVRAATALRSLPPVGRFGDGGPGCRPVQIPLPP